MSQNDYVIANQTTPLFRADLNLALQALASNSSGSTAPSPTYANMMWYDTSSNTLKMRSEADDAWITLGTLDQSLNTFSPAGVATVDQTTWDAGTSTTEALISPAKLAGATISLVATKSSAGGIGTYAFLTFSTGGATITAGTTYAGASLVYSGVGRGGGTSVSVTTGTSGAAVSGTWRAMGTHVPFNSTFFATTLFLRIA